MGQLRRQPLSKIGTWHRGNTQIQEKVIQRQNIPCLDRRERTCCQPLCLGMRAESSTGAHTDEILQGILSTIQETAHLPTSPSFPPCPRRNGLTHPDTLM